MRYQSALLLCLLAATPVAAETPTTDGSPDRPFSLPGGPGQPFRGMIGGWSAPVWIGRAGAGLFREPDRCCVATLDGGTPATVLEARLGWCRLRLPDGTAGWVRPAEMTWTAPPPSPPPASTIVERGALGTEISYPAGSATATGIHRMACFQVSHGYHRCAASLADALGWGLGDAHDWVALPSRGFVRRTSGEGAQPGDIVVWPFTFGRNCSQHVGFAVGHAGTVKLLSNLMGQIELSDVEPGFVAFAPGPSGGDGQG